MNLHQNSIAHLSQEIEIDPANTSLIYQRSQIYTIQGQLDKAISDSTKLILLQGSRSHYVQRSQLFRSKGMFIEALKDIQTAKNIAKSQEQEETAIDIFLTSSACMNCSKQIQQMSQIIQSKGLEEEQAREYNKAISKLLQVKIIETLEKQHKKQLEYLKAYYEQQNKRQKEFFLQQLQYVKKKLNHTFLDYQRRFNQELQQRDLTDIQKRKLKLYFEYVASQMEKYYIAAKHLHKIQDNTISFEDFERIVNDKSKDYLLKIYKLFDRYGSIVTKIQQLIEHIPYIGTAFKVIKNSMKVKGWTESTKLEDECQNIQRIASNTTAFNSYSSNLAYYLAKHYQHQILNIQQSSNNQWQLLIKTIQKLKDEKLGLVKYRSPFTEDQSAVSEYAIVHGSIVMVSCACRHLLVDRQQLQCINTIYEKQPKSAMERLLPLFQVVSCVQAALKNKQQCLKEQQGGKIPQSSNSKGVSSYCVIY